MGLKIVIADDEEHLGYMIKLQLERSGYEVIWKLDGRQALESIREERPALVILDVMMPGLTGFEVLETMKADAELKHIPLVMLTDRSQ